MLKNMVAGESGVSASGCVQPNMAKQASAQTRKRVLDLMVVSFRRDCSMIRVLACSFEVTIRPQYKVRKDAMLSR